MTYIITGGPWNRILKAIMDEMKRVNYYPNVFYVNERGNVDLLSIRKRGRGYISEIVESWV